MIVFNKIVGFNVNDVSGRINIVYVNVNLSIFVFV